MMKIFFCLTAFATAGLFAGPTPVTYHKDVEPVLQARCQGCHRPGEAAPFSTLSYKDVRPWAKAIKAAVVARKMPPWFADPSVGHFRNNPSLSQAEIDSIVKWVDTGAPEGDAKDAPPPRQYVEGWNIGNPDVVFEMPIPFEVPAEGAVAYQWIVLPTGLTEDKWIQGVEVRPGDRSVVHHVIAFYRRPGSKWLLDAQPGVPVAKASGAPEGGMSDGAIGGYAPGIPPRVLSEGRAILLPKGSDLVLQMHYTASGKAARDQSKVGVVFARQPPRERAFGLAVANGRFVIPPKDGSHRVDAEVTLASDVRIVDFTPHMHLRGKSFEYRAVFPDGRVETLLRVPKYDFNWQLTYQLAEERVFPKGTRIEGTACFDNSPNNPSNPDPNAEVRFGDQTWDEMMVGFFGIVIDPGMSPGRLIERPRRESQSSE
ncbi:MAG: cytochrome c [Acidobacteria bacterium]|nr:cytochrome c [Acidobacteriota bacterium]